MQHYFNLECIDESWKECLNRGLNKIDDVYLSQLSQQTTWLPGPEKIFNAYTMPLENVNYVLFGESPYPRMESANGYAFWDQAVTDLWTSTGLSKKVNRATSLRNIIKMLLVAEGYLNEDDVSQEKIAQIDKTHFVQTNSELFQNFLDRGFLLLNATPVLNDNNPKRDAKAWQPFIRELLACLLEKKPEVKFILLGRIASTIEKLIDISHVSKLCVEHPYNYSFIHNQEVIAFFKPLKLLQRKKQ